LILSFIRKSFDIFDFWSFMGNILLFGLIPNCVNNLNTGLIFAYFCFINPDLCCHETPIFQRVFFHFFDNFNAY